MPLTVTSSPIGNKLNRLLIFQRKTLIGEYERAQADDIPRKKVEVSNAEAELLAAFCKHGLITVRWSKGGKIIRNASGVQVGQIFREHWEKPSWR